jgi:hypothetical protein
MAGKRASERALRGNGQDTVHLARDGDTCCRVRAWCARRPTHQRVASRDAHPRRGREEGEPEAVRCKFLSASDEQGGVREWCACDVAPPGIATQKAMQGRRLRRVRVCERECADRCGRVRTVAAAAHPTTRRRSGRHRSPGLRWRGSTPDARNSPRQPTREAGHCEQSPRMSTSCATLALLIATSTSGSQISTDRLAQRELHMLIAAGIMAVGAESRCLFAAVQAAVMLRRQACEKVGDAVESHDHRRHDVHEREIEHFDVEQHTAG